MATLFIRLYPAGVADALRGDIGFITSIPVSWLCVRLICRAAGLQPHQILAGCMVVLGDAMLIDGAALRWFHTVYATDERTARLAAAWLLWGYGLSAWIALFVARRRGGTSHGTSDHGMADWRGPATQRKLDALSTSP